MTHETPLHKNNTKRLKKKRHPVVHGMRIIVATGLVTVALLSTTAIGGYMWLTGDNGREWLRDVIVDQVSTDELRLSLERISELSLKGIAIENAVLYEKDEILLSVAQARVTIDPYDLFWRRIHITEIALPDIYFHRLPSANESNDTSAPLQINDFSVPDLQIDALNAVIRLSGDNAEILTIKGNAVLDPNKILNSNVELDVSGRAQNKLIEIRMLPQKKSRLLFARVNDPNGLLLKRFADMPESGALNAVWQGAMQDNSTWQGDLQFSLQDVVSGDLKATIKNIGQEPELQLKGMVSPISVTANALGVDAVLSSAGLDLSVRLPEWVEDDIVIVNPLVRLRIEPFVQYLVKQGYLWNLKASFDKIVENSESITSYAEQMSLDAKGRLSSKQILMTDVTTGNPLWKMTGKGQFDLVKYEAKSDVSFVLQDQSAKNALGEYPKASAVLSWNEKNGLNVSNGVLDLNAIQGKFEAVLDSANQLLFRLNAKVQDFEPHFKGLIELNAVAEGNVSDPQMRLSVTSKQLALSPDTVIEDVDIGFSGTLNKNVLSASVLMNGEHYAVTSPVLIQENGYGFDPIKIDMPLGQINGKINLVGSDAMRILADLRGTVENQVVSLNTDVQIEDEADADFSILLNRVAVEWKKLKLVLQKPVRVMQVQDKIQWNDILLNVSGGNVQLSGFYDPNDLDINLKVQSVPLSVIDLPIDNGKLDGTLRLSGTDKAPIMDAALSFKDLVPQDLGVKDEPVSLSGNVKGHFSDGNLAVNAVAQGMRNMRLQADITLPMQLIPFELRDDAPLKGVVKGDVELAAITALAPMDGHELNGKARIDATLSGVVSAPVVAGTMRVRDGSYENIILGTRLSQLNAEIGMTSSALTINRLTATDGKRGQFIGSGQIGLKPLDNPDFNLTLRTQRMQVLNSDSLVANATSNVFIKGRMNALTISGDIQIHSAEIFVDDVIGSGDPYRDYTIIEKNVPNKGGRGRQAYRVTRAEKENPILLDLSIEANNAIFVRGPGLDSEWKTALSVRGTTDRPRLNGTLSVLRGTYQFVDLLVRLDPKSQVLFNGDADNPELALSGIIPGKTLNATLSVSGTAQKPTVELGSDQGLPSDEILSRVLFGRSASGLSPAQAVQVARILARLSGQGGTGFDPVGMMRKALGVDTLGVSMGDEDGAGPTVSAGKYISDDVYVSVEQGTTPNSSSVRSEIGLTDNIQLESEISNSSDSKVGIQWKWDY